MDQRDWKKLALEELQHSMAEWAVSKSTSNSEHSAFRSKAIGHLQSFLNVSPSNRDSMNKNRFPKDLNSAYEHVLRHDDPPGNITTYSDKLDMQGYLEPYRRQYDRNDKTKVYSYIMKQEYKRYSSDELDPLERFTFHILSKEEFLFQEWFLVDDENDASHLGLFYETRLACHALQHETCYNCKFKNALRWNGGASSSWQDLVCISCKSTYEVKTKADMERVENAFKWNNIPGGSFSKWCELYNEKRQPDQKRFLVVLPRSPTLNRQLNKVHPVQIAEIAAVLPSLYPGSFNQRKEIIQFKSTISVKINTKAKWFDLPSTFKMVNTLEIAKRVFIERFSQSTFDSFMELYLSS
eukprot:CCRYP_019863-RA/>CCRYP_019863-RA protein AED:0.10 eAED:0.13 QI:0/1/0/1/1/1/2/0/352